MRLAVRRFFELFFTCVVISAAATLIFRRGYVLQIRPVCAAILTVGVVIFILVNIRMLSDCYMDLNNIRQYMIGNFAAYGAFLLINGICLLLGSAELYTYLFGITKFIFFMGDSVPRWISLAVFHILTAITIIFTPIWINRMTRKAMEWTREEKESFYRAFTAEKDDEFPVNSEKR